MMELEDWALENAALLVSHVERHGIAITWSEAHDQLLRSARWLETPVYVDDGEAGLSPLASAVPGSQRPDFVEEVAAGIVLDEGRPFFSLDPAKAETPIALPWALASELVHRLSLLLAQRLMELPGNTADITPLVELSLLVSRLSADVSDEMSCVPADGEGVCVIDNEPYLLMPACAVWKGAMLLRDVEGPSAKVLPVVAEGDYGVTVREATDTFLWDLDWWLTDRSGQ
jgi:hypothetical protein